MASSISTRWTFGAVCCALCGACGAQDAPLGTHPAQPVFVDGGRADGGAGGGGRNDSGTGPGISGGAAPISGAGAGTGSAAGGAAAGGTAAGGTAAGGTAAGGTAAGGGGGTPTRFVCSEATGLTLSRLWYLAGFDNFIDKSRWQLKAAEHGYITEWANPNSTFWNTKVEFPCAQSSASPDRVVLTILDWPVHTQPQWEALITSAINNFKTKYSGIRRIDLLTIIRGPKNMSCGPTPATETIVVPAALDAAVAAIATQLPGFAFAGPKFEPPDCTMFAGGGPHLTNAGYQAMAKAIGTYFATIQ